MTYALITAVEADNINLNSKIGIKTAHPRLLESESILCFESWRKNADWLKDISIYAYCPTHNKISGQTKKKYENLKVTYIEKYHKETESFTSGFLNIPFVGMLLEERLKEDILIKLDLDMTLIKPLPKSLFSNVNVICGQYDDYCSKQQRFLGEGRENPFDTSFIISRRTSGFYKTFFEAVKKELKSPDHLWLAIKKVSGDYFLEEYIIDKMYAQKNISIKPIQKYQIGEWYTPVSELTDKELESVYFWHEHILHDLLYKKTREKIEYFKRMQSITGSMHGK